MAIRTIHTNPKPQEQTVVLQRIYEGTAAATGDEFFRALVRSLASTLNVHYSFISEFAGSRDRVRTLAFWCGNNFIDNVEYDLHGTPCQAVLRGDVCFYDKEIQRLFPEDGVLVDMNAESYLAIPITDNNNEVLGHLAILDIKPMKQSERDLTVFKIFGARAAAELTRLRAEQQLESSEKRLSNILKSAMDAIITINEQHRIVLFNQAAEQIFGCAAKWAYGQTFDRFLSSSFQRLLEESMQVPDLRHGQRWSGEKITALRAGGEEFPIEASISPFAGDGEKLYTIILRDVETLHRIEQELRALELDHQNLREVVQRDQLFPEIIGDSPAMQVLRGSIDAVASTDATVLIHGETGTGKELIARALHTASPRKDALFVVVNCAALPSELVESELFGHEKGAFTGATAQRKGRFELADGGTIFLDEIGELPPLAQAKLLRVLQEQEFERVGGNKSIKVNVRVIAATNRNMTEMISTGKFRDDLYYRLNVFPIKVVSLRERSADISLLADMFLDKLAAKLNKSFEGFSSRSMQRLQAYNWPGNVRELQNVIERAAILSSGPIVEISSSLISPSGESHSRTMSSGSLEEMERAHILSVLDRCQWVIEGDKGAAKELGLKPSTLRFRMRKLNIRKHRAVA